MMRLSTRNTFVAVLTSSFFAAILIVYTFRLTSILRSPSKVAPIKLQNKLSDELSSDAAPASTTFNERIGPNISPLSASKDIVHASFAKMESASPRGEKVKWYVVGPQNSGTNFVYKQFEKNCPKIGVFEARWVGVPNDPGDDAAIEALHHAKKGKHTIIGRWPPVKRKIKCMAEKYGEKCIALVVVRDPLTWFRSQCKHPYYGWMMPRTKRTPTCATPFENTESDLRELHGIDPKTNTRFHYKTLAHAWNAWYAPFFEEGNAFRWFFIRYEDMLLRTEEITRRVCDHFGSRSKTTPFANELPKRIGAFILWDTLKRCPSSSIRAYASIRIPLTILTSCARFSIHPSSIILGIRFPSTVPTKDDNPILFVEH